MKQVIVVCAWCKQKMKQGGVWQQIELRVINEAWIISHGICSECVEAMGYRLSDCSTTIAQD